MRIVADTFDIPYDKVNLKVMKTDGGMYFLKAIFCYRFPSDSLVLAEYDTKEEAMSEFKTIQTAYSRGYKVYRVGGESL